MDWKYCIWILIWNILKGIESSLDAPRNRCLKNCGKIWLTSRSLSHYRLILPLKTTRGYRVKVYVLEAIRLLNHLLWILFVSASVLSIIPWVCIRYIRKQILILTSEASCVELVSRLLHIQQAGMEYFFYEIFSEYLDAWRSKLNFIALPVRPRDNQSEK